MLFRIFYRLIRPILIREYFKINTLKFLTEMWLIKKDEMSPPAGGLDSLLPIFLCSVINLSIISSSLPDNDLAYVLFIR